MSRRGHGCRSRANTFAAGMLLPCALIPWQLRAQSQAWVPEQGHGSVSLAYQQLFIEWHTLSDGAKGQPGTITNHTVFLNLDYGLTDRLALSVGMPYKSNKFDASVPGGGHDPRTLENDHGEQFMDDGHYHSGWQDLALALRYQWRSEPWAITPFLAYGTPTNDYTTFSHAARGTGQWRLEAGVAIGKRFSAPLQNLYVQGSYGYAWMEKVDRRVNHSTLNLELGYLLTPRLSARVFVTGQKTHNGFEFPGDFPNRTDDHFFHHDQNLRNDFINVAAGMNYQLNDRYGLFGSYGRTVWGENTHLIDYAVTVGISRGF